MQSWQLHLGRVTPETLEQVYQSRAADQDCRMLSWQQHPDPQDWRMQSWQLHPGWVAPETLEPVGQKRADDQGCRMLSWQQHPDP